GAWARRPLEKFPKRLASLHRPAGRRVRTNNHVERVNRRLRYFEKVRYKWRRRRTIVRFVVLALERGRQRQLQAQQAERTVSEAPQKSQRSKHQVESRK